MSKLAISIDADIVRKARALGFSDACVTRYAERFKAACRDFAGQPVESASAEWFLLSVKRSADAEWEILGRRASRMELLGMLENRTYQPSTRPVGAIPGASCAIDFAVT